MTRARSPHVRPGEAGSVEQQHPSAAPLQGGERVAGVGRRERERGDAPCGLTLDAERFSARRQDGDAGAAAQDAVDQLGAGVEHALAVVDDEEQLLGS